ncbi:MAG: uracil phosphoribosyltransferase [Campylobacterota bacterium]|nr:uracil phosphoribosyltransferase [Campylobacterota bacterium]
MIHELSHPLAKTLINKLRQSETDALCFRHHVAELARLLFYEAFRNEPLTGTNITTWQGEENFGFIDERDFILIPILRAGMPMLEGLSDLLPEAASGFLAMKRDETTHKAVLYYNRVPDCEGKTVVLLDPMVATGGSLGDAIDVIKAKKARRIISLNLIGSPEGVSAVEIRHSDIDLYIAQVDERLSSDKFIVPGLGDAGDRAYNTPE